MGKRTKLHLAKNLSFGTDIITEIINIIAKRGSGKTYTATKLAEEMLSIGAQTVVIDPVGNWYGLRLGADGKAAGGMDITVIGGRHGDIPLEYLAGRLIAQTLVETGMSVILDLSMLSKVKQRRFVTEFSEALLSFRQKEPGAMHIFWEEAYRFMPQKMAKGSKNEMLEATEELITMGRNFGIGGTIITVRSALVSKTVLSQAGILIAMHTNAPGDRKVIQDWMDHHDLHNAVGDLHKLKRGEARVWWPEEFGIKEVKIEKKRTYNASATPKFGEKTRRRKLRAVDLDALQDAMSETIEKFKSEDPRLLKRRVVELERELAAERARPAQIQHVQVFDEDLLKNLAHSMHDIEDITELVRKELSKAFAKKPKSNGVMSAGNGSTTVATPKRKLPPLAIKRSSEPYKGDVKITAGALRMLKALAAVHPGGLTKKQVATAARMKSSSGTFGTYWSKLNTASFISFMDSNGRYFINDDGFAYLGDDAPTQPDTPEEKVEFWCERLSGKAKEMLKYLFNNSTELFTKAELGDAVGLVHTSGTFGTYLSSLVTNNLAVRDNGRYAISADLIN